MTLIKCDIQPRHKLPKWKKKYYKLEFTVEFMFHLRKIYSIEKHKGMD